MKHYFFKFGKKNVDLCDENISVVGAHSNLAIAFGLEKNSPNDLNELINNTREMSIEDIKKYIKNRKLKCSNKGGHFIADFLNLRDGNFIWLWKGVHVIAFKVVERASYEPMTGRDGIQYNLSIKVCLINDPFLKKDLPFIFATGNTGKIITICPLKNEMSDIANYFVGNAESRTSVKINSHNFIDYLEANQFETFIAKIADGCGALASAHAGGNIEHVDLKLHGSIHFAQNECSMVTSEKMFVQIKHKHENKIKAKYKQEMKNMNICLITKDKIIQKEGDEIKPNWAEIVNNNPDCERIVKWLTYCFEYGCFDQDNFLQNGKILVKKAEESSSSSKVQENKKYEKRLKPIKNDDITSFYEELFQAAITFSACEITKARGKYKSGSYAFCKLNKYFRIGFNCSTSKIRVELQIKGEDRDDSLRLLGAIEDGYKFDIAKQIDQKSLCHGTLKYNPRRGSSCFIEYEIERGKHDLDRAILASETMKVYLAFKSIFTNQFLTAFQ